ncbi:hemerythrin domain-containing protein [Streptomyces sp. NBC_01716]|uniref:hemerythrin domain-containing protein n=1 Tax=Streptomyces sp. NBC_01716 TaxID=2975917 RepID=UPI002E32C7FB|nr:hemerythrin domain-containing protein [Streptomyces sp. NBC_01716]
MTVNEEPSVSTREMYMVHTMLRREFSLLPALVREVGAGDRERVGVVAGHAELVASVLHHHHAAEDAYLWPVLLERGPEEIAPVVHSMEEQHAGIARLYTEATTLLDKWRHSAAAGPRDALAGTFEGLLPPLYEHLGDEERRVLPLIDRYITLDEWDRSVQEGGKDTPQELLPLMFGMMMYEGDPGIVARAVANMPPEVRPVIEQAAGEAFRAHSQRVHGTTTPRRSTV